MFQKGQAVVCIDHKMDGIGSILEKGKTYHIEEHRSPWDCEKSMPNNVPGWEKQGGRIEVREYLRCYWYGRRFEAVK